MTDNHGSHNTGGYEKRDISLSKTIGYGFGVVLLIVFFLVVLNEYFLAVKEEIIHQQVLSPVSIALQELRAHEDQMLNRYKIIDSAGGIYQIPIDRAMELIAVETKQKLSGSP